MSKFVSFETEFTDGKLLIEALTKMGLKGVQNHIGHPVRMQDFVGSRSQGRDADILVPRNQVGHWSNDLGFVRVDNGTYEAIISDYDQGRYNGNWRNKLAVEYSEVELGSKMKKLGFKLVNTGLKQNGNRAYQFQEI